MYLIVSNPHASPSDRRWFSPFDHQLIRVDDMCLAVVAVIDPPSKWQYSQFKHIHYHNTNKTYSRLFKIDGVSIVNVLPIMLISINASIQWVSLLIWQNKELLPLYQSTRCFQLQDRLASLLCYWAFRIKRIAVSQRVHLLKCLLRYIRCVLLPVEQ